MAREIMVASFEELFDEADLNKDGFMDVMELLKFVEAQKSDITPEQKKQYVKALLYEADANKDGKISKQEFVDYMMKTCEEALEKIKSEI